MSAFHVTASGSEPDADLPTATTSPNCPVGCRRRSRGGCSSAFQTLALFIRESR